MYFSNNRQLDKLESVLLYRSEGQAELKLLQEKGANFLEKRENEEPEEMAEEELKKLEPEEMGQEIGQKLCEKIDGVQPRRDN